MIDVDELLKKYGNDASLIVDLTNIVIKEADSNFPLLEKAVGENDQTGIQFYAHKLKGSVNTLMATAMANEFQAMENNESPQEHLARVRMLYTDFLSDLEKLKQTLANR